MGLGASQAITAVVFKSYFLSANADMVPPPALEHRLMNEPVSTRPFLESEIVGEGA
jgi:hypothetical protein